jgi:hypothetical protein
VASGASIESGDRPRGLDAGGAPLDVPCRCARTDAGGALATPATAGMVASSASIKPSEPGEVLHREALDAGDVSRPSTRPAAPPGPMPVARSAASGTATVANSFRRVGPRNFTPSLSPIRA